MHHNTKGMEANTQKHKYEAQTQRSPRTETHAHLDERLERVLELLLQGIRLHHTIIISSLVRHAAEQGSADTHVQHESRLNWSRSYVRR